MAEDWYSRKVLCVVLFVGALLCPVELCAQVNPTRTATRERWLQRAEAVKEHAVDLRKTGTRRNLRASSTLFTKSARFFESAQSNDDAARAYLEAAQAYVTFSEYGKARNLYRAALKLGSEDSRCRALSRTARIYATTGPLDLAERASTQAESACTVLQGSAKAEGLEARGEVLEFAGEHAKSAEYLERAAELFAVAHDDSARAQSMLMLAVALFSNGKQEAGFEAAGQALRLWSAEGDLYGIARVRAALGIFAITRGEFETAQCNYKIAEPILRSIGNKDEQASVLNGLGYVSRETGDSQKSLEYYQRARGVFASVRDLPGEHEAITGMGKALLGTRRYKELLRLAAAELRLARLSGDPALVASSLGDMAAVYEAEKYYEVSETFYRRALETYRRANHLYGEGDILIRLGRLQANRKKYSEALTLLTQANALKEKTGQVEEVAKIQFELASIYSHLDRLDEARSAIERTIEIVETQRITIAQFDSRASYFASVHRYYTLYIDLLMRLSERELAGDFVTKAFEASERSKVRSLLDLLTTSAQDARCEELLDKQLLNAGTNEARPPGQQKEERPAPTLTLAEVQAEIENSETTLLEYALGEDRSYVWAVSRKRITSHELAGAGQIREVVRALRKTMLPPQVGSDQTVREYQTRARKSQGLFEVNAKQLSRFLLGSVDLAEARRVLIVPDGSLQDVPFAALPLRGSGRATQLLIDKYEIDILPSASVLSTLRKASGNRAPPPGALAVFADPVFEQDDPRVASHRIPAHRATARRRNGISSAIRDVASAPYIPRLVASGEEARTISAPFGTQNGEVLVALGFDANRRRVLDGGLVRFRLLHFATHGVVDARHPEMSGLILSLVDGNGRPQDGYLRIGDIYKLRLGADLVVLSACESALGKDLESEGIFGLPRAFLYAGAKSVIASSWKVDDVATARMMSTLYARIRSGESPGAALRRAQLEMAHDERWSNPYFWAAFALQGDYR